MKLYVRFYVFLRFFQNPKKDMTFYGFFELLHTFSPTVAVANRMRASMRLGQSWYDQRVTKTYGHGYGQQ